MARTELAQRLVVAAVGIPAVVLALFLGRWVMGPVLAFFCAGAALEVYRLAEHRHVAPLRWPGMAGAAALVLIATVRPGVAAAAPALWTAIIGFLLLLSLLAVGARGAEGKPLLVVAVTGAGALLPAGGMMYAIFIRHLPVEAPPGASGMWASLAGVGLVAFPLMVTWVTDSAAFFGGRRWGRRKLAPGISPGKTVEGGVAGLAGGMIGGTVAGMALNLWLGIPFPVWAGAAGGLVIGTLSQLGDLAESVWKREAGVKDSGSFFPGHGGILDRMDSLLFTIPASYWWLTLFLPGVGAW
jgi:phosphatidate cytidylyltransferase